MLQQQELPLSDSCPQCCKKQEMIDKYTQLVHLLKKKTQKQDESKIKQSTLSLLTQSRSSTGYPLNGLTLLHLLQKLTSRRIQNSFTRLCSAGKDGSAPFAVRQHIIKQTNDVGGSPGAARDKESRREGAKRGIEWAEGKCISSIEKEDSFPEEKLKISCSQKVLSRKLFLLQHQRDGFASGLAALQTELAETLRRQQRQIAKKRQSLQGLVDELSQKNELIQQLRETIKFLQVKLGAKDNLVLHKLLQQDGQSLRRVIFKLENVNDRLNHELVRIRGQKGQLESQNKDLLNEVQSLRTQVRGLKEELFEREHQVQQNWFMRRELEIVGQKLGARLERVRRAEKRCNEAGRGKDTLSINGIMKVESELNLLQPSGETVVGDLEDKLQAIFSFLFNIENQEYQIHASQLFDEEEKELLLTHHHRFISSLKAANFNPIQSAACRVMEEETVPQDVVDFGDSLLDALEGKGEQIKVVTQSGANMKLIDLQVERSKLVERISELKQRHLHMRCVVLQLLKSLELRTMRKETEAILMVLCDFFQYSEEERGVILQAKAKKFFGLL